MSKAFFFMNDSIQASKAEDKREVYWPKSLGTRDYHEPSLRKTFSSKKEMRTYMRKHGLRDSGQRIDPEKHVNGRPKTVHSFDRAKVNEWVKSQGGTEGLLRRKREGRGIYV